MVVDYTKACLVHWHVMTTPTDVIIIGAGMAGCSAALWCQRLDLTFSWLEQGAVVGGQLARVFNPIPDYPGLMLPDGHALRLHLESQLADLGLAPRYDTAVSEVDIARRTVATADGTLYRSRALVIATGVEPRRLGVPGELELAGRGVGGSPRRDRGQFTGQPVAIVGGGDAACENALLLAEVCSRVVLIHRRATFRARPALLEAVRAEPRIEIVTDARVKAINGHEQVEGLRVDTPEGERTFDVRGVFVRIGVGPVTHLFQRQLRCDPDGYLHTDADQRTSDAWAWAVGDVCNPVYSSLATAAGQGMIAVKAISRVLAVAGNELVE